MPHSSLLCKAIWSYHLSEVSDNTEGSNKVEDWMGWKGGVKGKVLKTLVSGGG